MANSATAGAAAALAAALSWGGGDFSGGMGSKSAGGTTSAALLIVIASNALSLVALALICWLTHAPYPHGMPLLWGLIAGMLAGVSVAAFYQALSRGSMGPSAAVSALLAAVLPAAVSALLDGAPHLLQLVGFLIACGAIWTIAAGENTPDAPGTMRLAVLSGAGFGLYFTALRLANPLGVFEPLALARAASLVTCTTLWIAVRRGQSHTTRFSSTTWRWIASVAVLDTIGNLCLIWSTRLGRLDVAAVLGSLYPAGTILLAAWRLHERPSRRQKIGMGLAVLAVGLIAF
ncbi:MAG: DMT family transporter [Acidobacteriaceae bacterium]|nr:DMT family transporter [Acidobacteriaceae bacterium]